MTALLVFLAVVGVACATALIGWTADTGRMTRLQKVTPMISQWRLYAPDPLSFQILLLHAPPGQPPEAVLSPGGHSLSSILSTPSRRRLRAIELAGATLAATPDRRLQETSTAWGHLLLESIAHEITAQNPGSTEGSVSFMIIRVDIPAPGEPAPGSVVFASGPIPIGKE